jgi:hypothetical protein
MKPRHSHPRERIILVIIFSVVLVLTCSCTGSTSPPAKPAPARVFLNLGDANKTIVTSVPSSITITMPFVPSSGLYWQLASGGAGFSEVRPPLFSPPPPSKKIGKQIFYFVLTLSGLVPWVLDYVKPGPIIHPLKQFRLTLRGV